MLYHGISEAVADAEPDARDFFVNQATSEGIANTLTDEAARLLHSYRLLGDCFELHSDEDLARRQSACAPDDVINIQ